MSWNTYDINGGGMPWAQPTNNTSFGGTAAAAGVGAAIGSALFGGLLGGGVNKEVAVETSKQVGDLQGSLFTSALAAADRSYQQTIAFNQQMNGVDRDVLTMGYDNSRQMCDGFNASNIVALQNKYDYATQLAMIGYQQEKCCCETNQNIMRMGYETQLRDACYKNDTDKQLQEIKCLITTTEANAVMREQAQKIAYLEGKINKEEIISAMKPVAPVPAYIQANPYENFRPVVRVEHGCHDDRWGYNNCCKNSY